MPTKVESQILIYLYNNQKYNNYGLKIIQGTKIAQTHGLKTMKNLIKNKLIIIEIKEGVRINQLKLTNKGKQLSKELIKLKELLE